jgi:hypothetical protein
MSRRLSALLLLSLLLLLGYRLVGHAAPDVPLTQESKERILKAYHALPGAEIEKQKIAAVPTGMEFVKIDASDRIRSASFGHTTTLLVPCGLAGKPEDPNKATAFYVEYGRSTNSPGGTFGPFKLR